MSPFENDGPFENAADISVGVSDAVLLIVSFLGFIFLAATIYSIIITRLKSAEEIEEEDQDLNYDEKLANADVSTLNRAQRRARARHIMKQHRRVTPAATVGENDDGTVDEQQEHEEEIGDPALRHLSRKERQKAAKAAEKAQRRLFQDDRNRQQRAAQEAAQREKKERERRQAERADEERRIRQEKRHIEEVAEYNEWKTFLESSDGTKILTVQEWIQQLEKCRTVHVDSLADEFRIPSRKVIERILELIDSARVTGVLESDGRFIYVSQQEMESLAAFIRKQDKVSLQEIRDECNGIMGS